MAELKNFFLELAFVTALMLAGLVFIVSAVTETLIPKSSETTQGVMKLVTLGVLALWLLVTHPLVAVCAAVWIVGAYATIIMSCPE